MAYLIGQRPKRSLEEWLQQGGSVWNQPEDDAVDTLSAKQASPADPRGAVNQGVSARPQLPAYGDLGSLMQRRDPAMDERWKQAETNALNRSGYGDEEQEYGIGEAVRDFAPGALASILDVAVNKGQGLGNIAGASTQAALEGEAHRADVSQRAGAFASQARGQREAKGQSLLDGMYKLRSMERWDEEGRRADERLGQSGERLDMQKDVNAFKYDPKHPEAAAKARVIEALSKVDTTGMSNETMNSLRGLLTGNQQLVNAEPKAFASEKGQNRATVEDTEAIGGSKARVKQLEDVATNPELDEEGNPIGPTGTEAAPDSAFSDLARRNPKAAAKVRESDQDMDALLQSYSNLMAIRQQIDAIGMGPTERTRSNPAFAKLEGAWNDEVSRYQTKKFEAENRGVPQSFEQKIFDVKVGNPYAYEDVPGDMGGAAKSALTDHQAQMQGQFESMRRAQQQYRAKYFGGQNPGAAQQSQVAPEDEETWRQPYGPNETPKPGDSTVPVRGGRALGSIPKIPPRGKNAQPAAQSGGMVRMIDTEGEEGEVTEAEARELVKHGYKRVR